jgi:hypothetical protein
VWKEGHDGVIELTREWDTIKVQEQWFRVIANRLPVATQPARRSQMTKFLVRQQERVARCADLQLEKVK